MTAAKEISEVEDGFRYVTRLVEDLKRKADPVVESMKVRDQAMDEKAIKLPVGYKPAETAAIRIREIENLRNDRNLFERRVAVLQEEGECMRLAALSLEARLDKESADNVMLEEMIRRAYGFLISAHRTAKPSHKDPAVRDGKGGDEFCPTCHLLSTMRGVNDRRDA